MEDHNRQWDKNTTTPNSTTEDHKVLWDGTTSTPDTPLRRPIKFDSAQNSDLSDSFKNVVSLEDIISKSNLSVNAKEWFPSNYNKNSGSNTSRSVQSRLHIEIDPKAQTNTCHTMPVYSNGTLLDEPSRDLLTLEEIINTLIEDPGAFDHLLGKFIETFGPYYEDIDFVAKTVELIFNRGFEEPNFRYNAARLCRTIEEQCPLFRSELILRCEIKVKENGQDPRLALFLSEIYLQLKYDNLYGQLVIQTLDRVLSLGEIINVKAVCQALKLTGSSLESHYADAISKIFTTLNSLKHKQLSSSLNNLIDSVIALRNANWGQIQTSPTTTTNNRYNLQESQVTHDGPIFYGPDGEELTEEEHKFLTDNCLPDYLIETSDSEEVWDPDPEMDEEIQVAFRQFLQSSK